MINIMNHWSEIKKICKDYLPEAEEVRKVMRNVGAITSPEELGLDRDAFIRSFICAKDIRKRYGVLQLLEDIGKLEEAGEFIAQIYYK